MPSQPSVPVARASHTTAPGTTAGVIVAIGEALGVLGGVGVELPEVGVSVPSGLEDEAHGVPSGEPGDQDRPRGRGEDRPARLGPPGPNEVEVLGHPLPRCQVLSPMPEDDGGTQAGEDHESHAPVRPGRVA